MLSLLFAAKPLSAQVAIQEVTIETRWLDLYRATQAFRVRLSTMTANQNAREALYDRFRNRRKLSLANILRLISEAKLIEKETIQQLEYAVQSHEEISKALSQSFDIKTGQTAIDRNERAEAMHELQILEMFVVIAKARLPITTIRAKGAELATKKRAQITNNLSAARKKGQLTRVIDLEKEHGALLRLVSKQ